MGFTQTAQYVTISKRRCKPQPKKKLYVILCDREKMVVPVKADINPHPIPPPTRPWFMGGTPQFFGGSPEKTWEGPKLTLQREVEEESRRTLELTGGFHPAPILSAPPSGTDINTYTFYYSLDWRPTGNAWVPDHLATAAQKEMQRVVAVPRNIFEGQTDSNVIIGILENETNSVNAPGFNDFHGSHTARAFVTFIRDIWRGV